MSPSEASTKAQELAALRALRDNPAWRSLVADRIRDAHERHLSGVTDRGTTAEQRSQHLEAYHLARDLAALVPDSIARLERELHEFVQQQDVVDTRIVDTLGL